MDRKSITPIAIISSSFVFLIAADFKEITSTRDAIFQDILCGVLVFNSAGYLFALLAGIKFVIIADLITISLGIILFFPRNCDGLFFE